MPKLLKTDQYRWERSIGFNYGRMSLRSFDLPLEEGYIPSFSQGEEIPVHIISKIPKLIIIYKGKRAKFPERLDDYIWRQVNEPLRDMIEELEPGVHQFFPVEYIYDETGEKIYTDQNWYMFNIAVTLPARELIDFDHSDLLRVTQEHVERPEQKLVVDMTSIDLKYDKPNHNLVFKKGLFPNNHIWRLKLYNEEVKVIDGTTYKKAFSILNQIYVSDRFADEFKKRGFVGAKFYDIPVV